MKYYEDPIKKTKGYIVSTVTISIVIIIAFFYFIEKCARNYHSNRAAAIQNNKGRTSGKVIKEKYIKGRYIQYQYYYKGELIKAWSDDYNKHFKLNYCYEVWFDTTNPSVSDIQLSLADNCP